MAEIIIYTKEVCPYCVMAKRLFDEKKLKYTEIRIDLDDEARKKMIELSHRRTVPQIFINGQSIGGYDDLAELARSGKLDTLLQSTN